MQRRLTNIIRFVKGRILPEFPCFLGDSIIPVVDSPLIFEGLLPSFDLNVEIILLRGDDTDVLLIINTGGVVGHIEVDNCLIPRADDFCIQVASSLIGLISIGFIPKGDKEVVAAWGFIELNNKFVGIDLKPKLSVSNVSLLYPLIGQEIGVVFRIHDVVLISFDLSLEPVLQVNGIIR